MHFNAEEVLLGAIFSHCHQRRPHAETNLKRHRRFSAKKRPLTVSADYIREYAVFVAEDDTTSLGFFSLIPTDRTRVIELDHFWVRPGGMGCGVGRAMFRRARDEALRRGMRTIFIVSDPNAEEFYLRMGATRTGEVPPCSGDGGFLPTLEFPLAPNETKSPSGESKEGDHS